MLRICIEKVSYYDALRKYAISSRGTNFLPEWMHECAATLHGAETADGTSINSARIAANVKFADDRLLQRTGISSGRSVATLIPALLSEQRMTTATELQSRSFRAHRLGLCTRAPCSSACQARKTATSSQVYRCEKQT